MHWIDNTSAIAALVKGYSQAPDSLRILHAFAAFSLGLRASAWFVWVPSKANIADQPSRGEFELLRELGSTEVPFVFPPFEAWDQPAEAWIARAMQRCGGQPRPGATRGSVAIGNLRHKGRCTPADVRIDRPSGSPLRNPFRVLPGVPRERSVAAFAALLRAPRGDDDAPRRIVDDPAFGLSRACLERDACQPCSQGERLDAVDDLALSLSRGNSVRLMCWCYPRACHGQPIAQRVRERARDLGRRANRRASRNPQASDGA